MIDAEQQTSGAAQSYMHMGMQPQTVEVEGMGKVTFSPVTPRMYAEIEARIRAHYLEIYMRAAKAAGVAQEEQLPHITRIQFSPLDELRQPSQAFKTNGKKAQAEAVDDMMMQWMQTMSGVDFIVWRCLHDHRPQLKEDALPFSVETKMRLFTAIMSASGIIEQEEPGSDPRRISKPAKDTGSASPGRGKRRGTTGASRSRS